MKTAPKRFAKLKPRTSHHKHSLKRRPHSETSYALLVFLILLAALLLFAVTAASLAAPGDPVSGDISFTTAIMTAPPSIGARFTSPQSGQRFVVSRIQAVGTCVAKRLVKITKNNVFAGSGLCDASGRFSIPIDLFTGQNELSANNYDAADQPGPTTPAVVVYYDSPNTGSAVDPLYVPLQILGPTNLRAFYVGQTVPWPMHISGGRPPYAINFDWGDKDNSVISRTAPGDFDMTHTYTSRGTGVDDSFPVVVTVTDSAGNTIQVSFVIIIRDKFAALKTEKLTGGSLMIAWPILAVAGVMVLMFWLGEKATEHILANRATSLQAGRR